MLIDPIHFKHMWVYYHFYFDFLEKLVNVLIIDFHIYYLQKLIIIVVMIMTCNLEITRNINQIYNVFIFGLIQIDRTKNI